MQSIHKPKQRLLSILLVIVMIFSLIPANIAFAASDVNNNVPGGGDGSSNSKLDYVWNAEEGIRLSIFWAPLKGNQPDWSAGGGSIQIGTSVDLRSESKFANFNYGTPTNYGDFNRYGTFSLNNARAYLTEAFMPKNGKGYTAFSIPDTYASGSTHEEAEANKDNPAKYMKFPILFTAKANGVDPDWYFNQWNVYNQMLWMVQALKYGGTEADRAKAPFWVEVAHMDKGLKPNRIGETQPGQYIIVLEPILLYKVRSTGASGAVTLREMLSLNAAGSRILNDLGTPSLNLANALYVKKDWPMLGLLGSSYSGTTLPGSVKGNVGLARSKFGISVIEFTTSKPEAIPVVKYYYDLSTGKHTEQWEWETADNIKLDPSTGSYTAAAKEDGYQLVSGTVSSIGEIKGLIEQKVLPGGGGDTKFLNKKDNSDTFTDEAIAKLKAGGAPEQVLNDNYVKSWGTPRGLVTTVNIAKQRSALAAKEQIIKANPDGTISFEAGSGTKDLQLSLLYIKGEIPKTHITKLYYDDETTGTPKNIVVEEIPRGLSDPDLAEVSTGGYEIKNEDPYKVTNWTFVTDKIINTPDGYGTWDEAQESKDGKSGTSTGPLNDGWKDHELVIRYEKKEQKPEVIDSELYLPERRISWHKSLADLGGVPTITFSWAAITGSHLDYDGCGTEKNPCPGHTCNEGTHTDTFFRFVASNLLPVSSQIMGNKTNFMPYDKDNVYEMNRSKSGGTYEMHPDYGFVIWRGKDIPTIASYKYGDTTGSGTAPSAPIIKNLIGETQAGIAGKGARNPNNNGSYMDGFSINEGKSNYDTGNKGQFDSAFGNDAGYDGKVNSFHDADKALNSAKLDLAEKTAALAQAESYMNECKSELDQTLWEHSQGRHYNKYSCSECARAQSAYDASVRQYNAAKAAKDVSQANYDKCLATYNEIGKLLGRTETGSAAVVKNVGDYDYNTQWSFCKAVDWYNSTGDSKTFTPTTRVDVGYGTEGVGKEKVTFKSSNLNAFGKEYTNVTGFPINNTKNMEFWPYVEMVYDTSTGAKDQKVYVLGGHKSTVVPQDYVEIGYLPVAANSETSTGLLLQSQQWSTHQAALSLAGGVKNKVLPGGAIYRLTTPGAGTGSSKATTVAVSSWLTFFPNDTINATVAGKDVYNGASQNTKNEALYRQVLNSLNSLDIIQIVNNTQVLQEKAGSQKVTGTSGQPTSKDAKYWLSQNIKDGTGNSGVPASNDLAMKINSVKPNEADLDITNTKEERIYYRIYSDTAGNVYVSKSTASADATKPGSGGIIAQINKTQGLNDLLKVTEVKALNNRTNVVTNYLASIDRNIGADQELIAAGQDGKWYNEAFDGICVVRINKQIEVGFKDSNASQAARTAAIDPKLTPVRKSQSDLFKSKATSWFETDNHTNLSNEEGYVGTFSSPGTGAPDTKIVMQNMNGIYKSKVFFIPNVSVQDLY